MNQAGKLEAGWSAPIRGHARQQPNNAELRRPRQSHYRSGPSLSLTVSEARGGIASNRGVTAVPATAPVFPTAFTSKAVRSSRPVASREKPSMRPRASSAAAAAAARDATQINGRTLKDEPISTESYLSVRGRKLLDHSGRRRPSIVLPFLSRYTASVQAACAEHVRRIESDFEGENFPSL
ncbi:hypothetical protein MRX96_002512 [Rhipicephalus microplus]